MYWMLMQAIFTKSLPSSIAANITQVEAVCILAQQGLRIKNSTEAVFSLMR